MGPPSIQLDPSRRQLQMQPCCSKSLQVCHASLNKSLLPLLPCCGMAGPLGQSADDAMQSRMPALLGAATVRDLIQCKVFCGYKEHIHSLLKTQTVDAARMHVRGRCNLHGCLQTYPQTRKGTHSMSPSTSIQPFTFSCTTNQQLSSVMRCWRLNKAVSNADEWLCP